MAATETFQITAEQAEVYEERFVPALFAHWVDAVLDSAGPRAGQDVLDVACGTGIVARHAAERVGPTGHVTGLDLNPAMLAVAARVAPDLAWRQGDVARMPFDDDRFDVVTCQSAAMFFPDLAGALREMARVTRPGGVVAVQVFDRREDQPAYGPWIAMVARHAGKDALRMLGTYWVHGDRDLMRTTCGSAGLRVTAVHDHERPACFPSLEAMVLTEVNATPLGDRLSQGELDAIVADSYEVFEPFRTAGEETLTIPLTGYVVVATPEPGVVVPRARPDVSGRYSGREPAQDGR
ncbi:MAG TPA: methyltransferase domain-containing protein [Pedococcus sp.]|nr:methyltransferase domain-containing protein [Pedococcus sp.]